jgi:hypothetical protein
MTVIGLPVEPATTTLLLKELGKWMSRAAKSACEQMAL